MKAMSSEMEMIYTCILSHPSMVISPFICWMKIRSKSFASCHTRVLESLHTRSFTTSLMYFSLAKKQKRNQAKSMNTP